MESKLNQQAVQQMYQMVLSLKTQEECAKFFEDLCTVQELKALSQRLHVARMLDQNRVYSDIVQQTGASTATISRVNRWLLYGAGGYRIVFDRVDGKSQSNPIREYRCLARCYDRFQGEVDYGARAAYFDGLLKEYGNGGKLLLDLACGTGSLSFEMEKLGYDVVAVDASQEMLSKAAEKKLEKGSKVQFLCQDMEELNLYGTVDCCICALDSLNHLPDAQAVVRALDRVGLFLAPGGVLIFDVNTVYKHRQILGDNTFVYEDEDSFLVWQNHLEGNRVDYTLDLFERTSGEDLYLRDGEEFSETAYSPKEMAAILDQAGLVCVQTFDEDSHNPPRADSQRLVYVTKNKEFRNG